ncbi:unnamed protein product [Closterium sp. NIES-54]
MQLVVDPYNLWGSRVDARKVPLKPFVVRYGDTLAALAVRFSVTIRDLQRINGMHATSEAPSVSNDATMADEEDVPVNTHVIFKHFLTSTEGTSNGPERTLRICRHCKLKFVGGAFRCAQHITRWKGLKRKDVRLCNAPIPSADRGAVRELYEGKHVRREGKKKAEEMAIEACAGGAKKQCIEDFYGEGASCAKESADDAICLMWAALHLPEHLADHPLWRNAVRCIADAGHGYVPPKRRYVGGAGLARCREKIERGLAPITASWKRDGVTISSDMMTDKSGRPQANILLINDSGAMFTESIDCKLETKTGGYIASVLRPIIEKVGPANIVALCMDGGSNYAAACRELMLEYPHIEHVPCATHVMDLLMEDIGEMDWAKDIVAKAGVIITFVRAHHFTKGYMRSPQVKGGKGKQVLKPAGTRFGTQFIAVQRLCEVRSALTQMVLSPQWQAWAKGRKPPVEPFATMIMDAVWWKGAEFFVALLKIPFVVMRKTDSTAKGMMGRMYDLMLQLTEDINAKLEEEEAGLVLSSSERTEVTNIVQKRWDHSMAWRTVTRKEGEELRASHVIQDGLTAFNTLQGSFGLPDAISDRELVKAGKKTAVQWWTWHGTEHPELTTLACRVLSQPVSASACERNWAVWESIHTSKRNRLGSEKCRDLVYVAHNWNIVRNWHKGAEGVTVLPGNIPEASLLEGLRRTNRLLFSRPWVRPPALGQPQRDTWRFHPGTRQRLSQAKARWDEVRRKGFHRLLQGWLPLRSPMDGCSDCFVSSPFGPRWGSFHRGVDVAAEEGEPIRAARSGVVTHVGEMDV